VAAFLAEPVIGAGGVLPPPPGYLEEAAAVCRRHGVLFVADSVISGFGRLGKLVRGGAVRAGARHDRLRQGRHQRLPAPRRLVVHERVAAPFWAEGAAPFRHGATYAGHPTACAAALANLDILEREDLLGRARVLEGELHAALSTLGDHPCVTEVRGGVGVLGALELDPRSPRRWWRGRPRARRAGRPMTRRARLLPAPDRAPGAPRQLVEAVRGALDAAAPD
jgi:adenosylmethionine-8-amino-7-oxononanoate aminotransferase